MRNQSFTSLLTFFLLTACGDKESGTDSATSDDTAAESEDGDDAERDESAGDGDESTGDGDEDVDDEDDLGSIEGYLGGYCEAVLIRCGMYGSTEACVADLIETHGLDACTVASEAAAEECLTFLEGVACDEQAWTDACDQVLDCG